MKTILLAFLLICIPWAGSSADGLELKQKEAAFIVQELAKVADGGVTGESWAWRLNYYLGPVLRNCEQDPDNWINDAEIVLNMLADKMATAPDGYKGFIGPYIYNESKHWCDVHVGDAILVTHMLRFSQIVHNDPVLKKKYNQSALRFVNIGKKDLIEKWEKRGTFVTDGPFAGYREWTRFCKPGNMSEWYLDEHSRGQDAPSPSLPFNKAMDMAHCMLQIYVITGEREYKGKAEKIYNRVKAGMNPYQGAYTWNYWEPISMEDINVHSTRNERILSHWVGTHPYRNYQDGEVSKIVYAYDMGVTFTEKDIRRLIKTNLEMMWNGDRENPEWANSDSQLPGYKEAPPSEVYPTTAGIYWNALSRFNSTICYLSKATESKNVKIQNSECVIDFTRKYMPDAVVDEPLWMDGVNESAGQTEAVVIPSVVPPGENAVILSKALAPMSSLEIYVRPLKGGTTTLITTQQMGNGIQLFHIWDGKIDGQRIPGEYVIIWKYMGGERAYPVTLM